jgi:hypothetical protein
MEDPDAVPNPNHPVDVPFANESDDMTAADAWRFWANRLVEVVFVPVALVQTRFANEDGEFPVRTKDVAVTEPKEALVAETLPNCPLAANRLVVVTEVPVPSVNVSPCREAVPVAVRLPTVAEPMVAAFSTETPAAARLPTERLDPVAFVNVRAWRLVVPVAVSEPTKDVENVPFEAWTEEAKSVEPVAFVNERLWSEAVPVAVRLPTVEARAYREFAKRLVVVTEVEVTFARTAFQRREADPKESAASSVGMREVETPPSTARPVVVTLEPWASVKEMDWKEEEPRTVRVEETDTVLPNTKAPVEVPPLKTIALVVVLPAFVTVWKSETVPDGQFVPSAKHGSFPLT